MVPGVEAVGVCVSLRVSDVRQDEGGEDVNPRPLKIMGLTKRTFLRTILQGSAIMTTITASEARAGLYRLIDQTAESHKPIVISGKRANAVLVSEEDWSAIQETLYLLAIPGMRESIKDAMAEPLAKSKRALKW